MLGSRSVALAFETVQNFSEATGLKLNIQKTQGTAVRSSSMSVDSPSINWNNETKKVLGLKIGKINPKTIWKESLDNLRTQKLAITLPFQTWQAKSLLAKAKLLPQLAYVARTYPLDIATQRVVEAEFLNFLTTITLSMKNLQRPIIDGGIKYPNPTIYCKLFFISNLFNCIKIREKNLPFNSETYIIEYEVGLVLSRMYDLQKLNNLPHRDHLTPYYQQTIQILTENKISLEELQNGKIKDIYRRLILSDYHPFHADRFCWKLISQNILPNYLKTFNYRTVWNLFPFTSSLDKYALCLLVQDSAIHLFAKCSITKQVWKNFEDVINSIIQNPLALDPFTAINFYLPKTLENHSDQISFLLAVTNYCVWQTRNKQLKTDNLNPIDFKIILSKLFNHITICKRKN